LAIDHRDGRPVRVGATVSNADETFAAVEEGSGIVLIAAGNAAIYQRPGTVAIPVSGLTPSELALAWRADDHRGTVRDFVETL
jgi:DNA-binding transcriptional LysR family regulator